MAEQKTALQRAQAEQRGRFIKRYRATAERRKHSAAWQRALRIVFAIALILMGVAIGWLPGPGFVILAGPGLYILAGESKCLAVYLDKFEVWLKTRLRRLRPQ